MCSRLFHLWIKGVCYFYALTKRSTTGCTSSTLLARRGGTFHFGVIRDDAETDITLSTMYASVLVYTTVRATSGASQATTVVHNSLCILSRERGTSRERVELFCFTAVTNPIMCSFPELFSRENFLFKVDKSCRRPSASQKNSPTQLSTFLKEMVDLGRMLCAVF